MRPRGRMVTGAPGNLLASPSPLPGVRCLLPEARWQCKKSTRALVFCGHFQLGHMGLPSRPSGLLISRVGHAPCMQGGPDIGCSREEVLCGSESEMGGLAVFSAPPLPLCSFSYPALPFIPSLGVLAGICYHGNSSPLGLRFGKEGSGREGLGHCHQVIPGQEGG